MRLKNFFLIAVFILLGFLLVGMPVASARAQGSDITNQLQHAGGATGAGLSTTDPRTMAAGIIRVALSLVGILLVAFLVYAGFLWMTAGGNEENIEKAKGIIKNSIIGLVIVLLAYSLTWFVMYVILAGTSGHIGP